MRISIIGPTAPYKGGISHYNTVLCQKLNKKHKVDAISFTRQYPKLLFPGKEQRDTDSKEKIEFQSKEIIDTINPFTWITAFKRIKKFNPQIVLLYWWTPYFTFNFLTISWLVKKFTNAKVVFLCHNVAPHEARSVDKILTKIALRETDYFITHGTRETNRLKEWIPGKKIIQHVHPIYDVFKEKFQKKNINLKLRKKVLLFFGFVRKYKGLDYLLKAMPKIVEKFPDLDLLVVGEFWDDAKEDEELIKNSPVKDHIKLINDYIPNEAVGNYFLASDICVLPYRSATNSGIVQTAFAFEKPCIVTDVGALSEVVLHDKTGLVIEPNSTEAVLKAVTHFYENNKAEEYHKNLKEDLHRFSWDRMIEIFEDINKNKR
jgi:glycosyltransferase involved in cell wall biosynthesis